MQNTKSQKPCERFKPGRFSLLLVFLTLIQASVTFAEWGRTPEEFVRISGRILSEPQLLPDGNGGAWIVCLEGIYDTEVHHIDVFGNLSWNTVGVHPFERMNANRRGAAGSDGSLYVAAYVENGEW